MQTLDGLPDLGPTLIQHLTLESGDDATVAGEPGNPYADVTFCQGGERCTATLTADDLWQIYDAVARVTKGAQP